MTDLTAVARVGYDGSDNPHLFSSPNFYAHALGRYLHDSGRSVPHDVRMGRGYSIRANGLRFKITHPRNGAVTFERVE